MSGPVQCNIENFVAEVVLNRPEKYNALDATSFTELVSVAESLKHNDKVRAVIIRGEGNNFCSGADVDFLRSVVSSNTEFRVRALNVPPTEDANEFQKPALIWQELKMPVISVLQGVVYGAGLQIALASDIRIADDSCQMCCMEIHWGLIPDMGITQTLRRHVRADVAADLMFTGRVVAASESLEKGLLTQIVPNPLENARSMAAAIASLSPDAVQKSKHLLHLSELLSRKEALALEARLQAELVGSPNQLEAVAAKLEKRKPLFN